METVTYYGETDIGPRADEVIADVLIPEAELLL